MDWGTPHAAGDAAGADAYEESLKERFPRCESAYVPSGRMGTTALPWLFLGSAAGAPIGGIVGLVVGAIALLLFALVGGLIALVAACGWVVCITVILEIGIALIGLLVTFGVAGAVPAFIVASAGKRGLNRSPMAAVFFSLPSALASTTILVGVPYVLSMFVPFPAAGDEVSVSGFVHLVAGFTWVHLGAIVLGYLIALGAAGLLAYGEVGLQKFCERCQRYMDMIPLPGASFDRAAWIFDRMRAGAVREVPPQLAGVAGEIDVQLELFRCPNCAAGFLEGRAHARSEWVGAKGEKEDRHTDWLCFSAATAPKDTDALATCRPPMEAET
jgi:hypothetical protein